MARHHGPDKLTLLVGERIGNLRKETDHSRAKLNRLAGIGNSQISVLERGAASANIETIALIAKALCVSSTDLMNVDANAFDDDESEASNLAVIYDALRSQPERVRQLLIDLRR